ncbi:MAG: hypothetical protein OHK0022_21580 [Roseiflexaceae bacterium]
MRRIIAMVLLGLALLSGAPGQAHAQQGNTVEGRIYVIRTSPLPVEYTVYADLWREGQPETAG